MLVVPMPTPRSRYLMLQVELAGWLGPIGWSWHLLVGTKTPEPSVVHIIGSIGGIAPDAAVSVTVTVHVVDSNTSIWLGVQDTLLLIGYIEGGMASLAFCVFV